MAGGGGLAAAPGLLVGVILIVTGAGCGVPQGEVCRSYVACQNAVDATVDTSVWDDGGRCWDLPDTARRCEADCRVALDALLATPDPPPACLAAADLAVAATGATAGL